MDDIGDWLTALYSISSSCSYRHGHTSEKRKVIVSKTLYCSGQRVADPSNQVGQKHRNFEFQAV